jgi:hypothetical protein
MAKITFKAKVQKVYNMDDTLAYSYVKIPKLNQRHCDMNAFRQHPKYGGYANSTLFPSILGRIVKELFTHSYSLGYIIKLDEIPEGVKVDTSKFLAEIEINV